MPTTNFPPGADDVLHIVDLSGYVFRAYHAVAPLSSPTGEPTHAVFGTVNMLERLVREAKPKRLVIALDSAGDTFRKEMYPEYKANRPAPPEDLVVQLRRVKDVVDAFSVPVLKESGLEADDLIASATRIARAAGLRVVIVTADKDLMQLVSDDVLLWDTMRDRVVGPPEVDEKFGVPPALVGDVLALMGDSSDNVPGVPSVGPKTAKDLLLAHGSLDGLYAALDKVERKKLRETLTEHREAAFLSRKLVALKDDAELDPKWLLAPWERRDAEKLAELYGELGFTRLRASLGVSAPPAPRPDFTARSSSSSAKASAGAPAASAPAAASERFEVVFDETGLRALSERLNAAGRFALDVVPAVDEQHRTPCGIAFGLADGAAYVPLEHRGLLLAGEGVSNADAALVAELLGPVLANPLVDKLTYDGKTAENRLANAGLVLDGVTEDALLAAYVLDAEADNRLAALAKRELGADLAPLELPKPAGRAAKRGIDERSAEELGPIACARADAIRRLAPRLAERVTEESLDAVYRELELPLRPLLAELERRGVLVDVSQLGTLGVRIDRELSVLEKKAHEVAGKVFNVHAPRQLETILFDELGLKPQKRTKTSRSTDAETLEALSEEHPLPDVILELRQLSKLKGTYIDSLPQLVDPRDGRIHGLWEQAVAATGRISSTEPNLQNIPIRSELGRAIRATFIAEPGHRIVSADYSQIELRVLAHLSHDARLVEAFQTGQDVHLRTAMEIFDLPAESVTSEHRRRAKAVNFGVIYGQGESGLAKSLGIARAEASQFIAAYFRRYDGVRRYMDETLTRARASEAITAMSGRRRHLPDVRSGNRARRLAAERIAMNMPIQGTAADILKRAMLALAHPPTPGTKMILTVHDELVFEVPISEVDEAKRLIQAAMQSVVTLDVPLVVDVGDGPSWAEAH